MARKRKQSKRTRVTTKDRLDYRTGGRVGYPHGGPHFGGGKVPGEPTEEEIQRNIKEQELLLNVKTIVLAVGWAIKKVKMLT